MKCEKCGQEMREVMVPVGPMNPNKPSEWPPPRRIYTCMNPRCKGFNYPRKIEGLTL